MPKVTPLEIQNHRFSHEVERARSRRGRILSRDRRRGDRGPHPRHARSSRAGCGRSRPRTPSTASASGPCATRCCPRSAPPRTSAARPARKPSSPSSRREDSSERLTHHALAALGRDREGDRGPEDPAAHFRLQLEKLIELVQQVLEIDRAERREGPPPVLPDTQERVAGSTRSRELGLPPLPPGEGGGEGAGLMADSASLSSLEIRNAACLATPLGTIRAARSASRARSSGSATRRCARRKASSSSSGAKPTTAASTADARPTSRSTRPGKTLLPGFVDCHTHPVWAGDRGEEIGRRLAGESYASIAARGGGIAATVAATRAASDEDAARARGAGASRRMLSCGTTTVEAKSGYGLTAGAGDPVPAPPRRARLSGPSRASSRRCSPRTRSRPSTGDRRGGMGPDHRRGARPSLRAGRPGASSATSSARRASSPSKSRAGSSKPRAPRASGSGSTRTSSPARAARSSPASSAPTRRTTSSASAGRRSTPSPRAGTVAVILPGTAWWMRSKPAPGPRPDRGGRPGRRRDRRQSRAPATPSRSPPSPPTPVSTPA